MSCTQISNLQKSEDTCTQGFVDELVEALRDEEGCDEDTIRANWRAVCADAPLVGNLDRAARNNSNGSMSFAPTGFIAEILQAFDFVIPQGENTWVGVMRAKIIDSNVALLDSVVQTISSALEGQVRRFMRIIRLMAKLGATMAGGTDSVIFTMTNKAFDAAERLVNLIANKNGWVLRAVAGIGIVLYMWQACMGDPGEDSWVSSYTSAIDWVAGIFDRIIGSIPYVGGSIMVILNHVFGNQIVVIKVAFSKLQLQLSSLTSFCRSMSEPSESDGNTGAGNSANTDQGTNLSAYDAIQDKIDKSFAEAFDPYPT